MEQLTTSQSCGCGTSASVRGLIDLSQGELSRNARLGDILVAANFVSRDTLEKALESREGGKGVRIGELLKNLQLISDDQLLTALSIKFRMSFVDLDTVEPDPEALRALPKEVVSQMQILPIARAGKKLTVATSQPSDPTIFDRISFSTSYTVELVAARAQQISAKITKYYFEEEIVSSVFDELTDEHLTLVEEPGEVRYVEPDSKVIRLVNRLLIDAQKLGASDIHFEPGRRNRPMKLRYRLDGDCFLAHELPAIYNNAIIARLKVISGLDIAERRKPQSGKILLQYDKQEMEYRVEITPTVGGQEDAVLRVLSKSKPIPLEEMGFSVSNLSRFTAMLARPYGIILCVGPTGSGKTTSLHSALAHINHPERKIWTAEDPVEIVQEGLRQVQVNPKIGFTFQESLKSFLRADPDVIMIGEIRDCETAKTAVAASLSGHLVFSTLHTNTAVETVLRLVEMGMEPYTFADALIGVLAQRLARRLCDACKEPYHPSEKEYRELVAHCTPPSPGQVIPLYAPAMTLMRKVGCEKCFGTGYKGRVAIHELLAATPALKEAIKVRERVETLKRIAMQDRMQTLKMDGISKVFQGITDLQQVLKVCLE